LLLELIDGVVMDRGKERVRQMETKGLRLGLMERASQYSEAPVLLKMESPHSSKTGRLRTALEKKFSLRMSKVLLRMN
jgi:hypothetical protein